MTRRTTRTARILTKAPPGTRTGFSGEPPPTLKRHEVLGTGMPWSSIQNSIVWVMGESGQVLRKHKRYITVAPNQTRSPYVTAGREPGGPRIILLPARSIACPENRLLFDSSPNFAPHNPCQTRCHCDDGYSGYDCSERVCPTGDDPGSWGQESEVQNVTLVLPFSFGRAHVRRLPLACRQVVRI